jgi:7-cyano-7-deazaguanine synthase in queuosine biosynthesis
MEHIIVDGVSIPFDSKWNHIAVSVSGGADSALLTYLLCNHIKNNSLEHIVVHVINHIRCWKTKPWQSEDSNRIWSTIVNEYPKIKFERHINFIAPDLEWGDKGPTLVDEYGKQVSGDNIEIRSYAEYICHQYNIDAYYNAVTRNPRKVEFAGMPTRDIEPNEHNQHLSIMKHMNRWALHPFRFIEKDWIYKQYKDLDILWLWDKTRSCEGTFERIDYTNYSPLKTQVPECGTCFWCKEREWAIEQNK